MESVVGGWLFVFIIIFAIVHLARNFIVINLCVIIML